jgi:hypothetical protein
VKPFHPLIFRDSVTFYVSTPTSSGSGSTRPSYGDGVEMAADVQSKTVDRVDTMGRVFTRTIHRIVSPTNPNAKAGDKFVWLGRTLIAEGSTIPAGIGDVIWITQTVETR